MGVEIYDDINYFVSQPQSFEQIAWETGQLRYGSQTEAVGYALGIESHQEVQRILEYTGTGRENYPVIGAKKQLDLLWKNKKREPVGVLEIGGGRGEVSVALSSLGCFVYMIEPCRTAELLLNLTKKMFDIETDVKLINVSLSDGILFPKWGVIDTVIFVESIEHIEKKELDLCIPIIKACLKHNAGYLIITNWIDYWPIPCSPPYHCTEMNDEFYDKLCEGGNLIYREGSHLVIRY